LRRVAALDDQRSQYDERYVGRWGHGRRLPFQASQRRRIGIRCLSPWA